MGTLDHRGVARVADEVPRAAADDVRRALLERALPDLRRGVEQLNARLEVLPGFLASKWQLTRIRAEARQEEARRAGGPVGPLNDYHDSSYRQLARATRRRLGVMRRFLLDLGEVADRTPLSVDERQIVAELLAELDGVERHHEDDLELLRHASQRFREWLFSLDTFEQTVRDRLRSSY